MNLIPFLQQNNWFLKDKILKDILDKYEKFIFISPHLDDAVLSCGNLLEILKNNKKYILVITVFTKCTNIPPSPQAINFIEVCGYKSGLKLFDDRRKEDTNALKLFNSNHKHLGFIDAAWRCDFNKQPIYKNSAIQFLGKISKKDFELIEQIEQKLNKYTKNSGLLIIAPLGVGNHVDHVIINEVAKKLSNDTMFWEDYPYNRNKKHVNEGIKRQNAINLISIKNSKSSLKEKAIRKYKSQIESLYPSGIIQQANENYYLKKSLKLL